MEQTRSTEDIKREIVTQIAELARLLGMMSGDNPNVQKAREAHLHLSVLVGKVLDIPMP